MDHGTMPTMHKLDFCLLYVSFNVMPNVTPLGQILNAKSAGFFAFQTINRQNWKTIIFHLDQITQGWK